MSKKTVFSSSDQARGSTQPLVYRQVFELVAQIPAGKVATYQQIAQLAGLKNPRQVGRILHHNTQPEIYPCHRVIRSDGRVADGYAFGEQFGQIVMLRGEGVECRGGKIDLSRYKWQSNFG